MQVVIRDGEKAAYTVNLDNFGKDVVSFGRHPDSDIVLTSQKASRVHGCFYKDRGVWYIKDLNSTNGINHNNIKISEMAVFPGSSYLIASNTGSGDTVKIMILQEQVIPVIAKPEEAVQIIPQNVHQGNNMASLYLILISIIMIFMLFTPVYKLINVDVMRQSGWTYEISKIGESYNVLQIISALFMEEYTTSKGAFFIFIGGLFSIGFAIAITISSICFLKDIFMQKKIYSEDCISCNMYFSIGLLVSVYVFSFGLASTLDSWSNSLTTAQVSASFLIWLILGLAILSYTVLYRLYVAEVRKNNM